MSISKSIFISMSISISVSISKSISISLSKFISKRIGIIMLLLLLVGARTKVEYVVIYGLEGLGFRV